MSSLCVSPYTLHMPHIHANKNKINKLHKGIIYYIYIFNYIYYIIIYISTIKFIFNIVKYSIVTKAIDRFYAVFIKVTFFREIEQTSQNHKEAQKTTNTKGICVVG